MKSNKIKSSFFNVVGGVNHVIGNFLA